MTQAETHPAPPTVGTPDPADVARVMVQFALECRRTGQGPRPGLDSLADLLFHVHKAHEWKKDLHPRDHNGRFISKNLIQQAANGDEKVKKELEKRVDPKDRGKLDAAIADQEGTVGFTARGLSRHEAKKKREATSANYRKALEIAEKGELTAEDVNELAVHLTDPKLTVGHLEHIAGRLGAGGRSKASLRANLLEHARAAVPASRGSLTSPAMAPAVAGVPTNSTPTGTGGWTGASTARPVKPAGTPELDAALAGIDMDAARSMAAAVDAHMGDHDQRVGAAEQKLYAANDALRRVGNRQPEKRNAQKAVTDAARERDRAVQARDDYQQTPAIRRARLMGVVADPAQPDFVRVAAANRAAGRESADAIAGMVGRHLAAGGHDPWVAGAVAAEVAANPMRAAAKLAGIIDGEVTRQRMKDERKAAADFVPTLDMMPHHAAEAEREAGSLYAGDLDRFKAKWTAQAERHREEKQRRTAIEQAAAERTAREEAGKKEAEAYKQSVRYGSGKTPESVSREALAHLVREAVDAPTNWKAGEHLPTAKTGKGLVDESLKAAAGGRFALARTILDHGWTTDTRYAVKATPEMVAYAKSKGVGDIQGRTPPIPDILPKTRGEPARIIATKEVGDNGSPIVVAEGENGTRQMFDAILVANVKRLYPGAEMELHGNSTAAFRKNGELVGIVMPLSDDGKLGDVAPPTESPVSLAEVLEPGPHGPEDVRVEHRGVRVGAAKIRITGDDKGASLPDVSDRPYPSLKAAENAAKELAKYVHGADEDGNPVFRPKGQKTELAGAGKAKRDYYAAHRQRAAATKPVRTETVKVTGEDGKEYDREMAHLDDAFAVRKAPPDRKGKDTGGWQLIHTPTGSTAGTWRTRADAIGHHAVLGHMGVDWANWNPDLKAANPAEYERVRSRFGNATKAFEDDEYHPDMEPDAPGSPVAHQPKPQRSIFSQVSATSPAMVTAPTVGGQQGGWMPGASTPRKPAQPLEQQLAAPAKAAPAKADPQAELAKLPPQVRASVERTLGGLKDHADALSQARTTDKMFRGGGRYEREVHDNGKGKRDSHLAKLNEFRKLAGKNGIDADAVIAGLGGMPAHEPSPAGRDYRFADEPETPAAPQPTASTPRQPAPPASPKTASGIAYAIPPVVTDDIGHPESYLSASNEYRSLADDLAHARRVAADPATYKRHHEDYTDERIAAIVRRIPDLQAAHDAAEYTVRALRAGFEADPTPHEEALIGHVQSAGRKGLTADDVFDKVGLPNADAAATLKRLADEGEIFRHEGKNGISVYTASPKTPRSPKPAARPAPPLEEQLAAPAPPTNSTPPNPVNLVDATGSRGYTSGVGSQSAAPKPGGTKVTTQEPIGWAEVTGNSFPHKDAIRAAGGVWDSVNRMWRVPARRAAEVTNLAGVGVKHYAPKAKTPMPPLEGRDAPTAEQARDRVLYRLELTAEQLAGREADGVGKPEYGTAAAARAAIARAAAVAPDVWLAIQNVPEGEIANAAAGSEQAARSMAAAAKVNAGTRAAVKLIAALSGVGSQPAAPSPGGMKVTTPIHEMTRAEYAASGRHSPPEPEKVVVKRGSKNNYFVHIYHNGAFREVAVQAPDAAAARAGALVKWEAGRGPNARHRDEVRSAAAAGAEIRPDVAAEYPELAPLVEAHAARRALAPATPGDPWSGYLTAAADLAATAAAAVSPTAVAPPPWSKADVASRAAAVAAETRRQAAAGAIDAALASPGQEAFGRLPDGVTAAAAANLLRDAYEASRDPAWDDAIRRAAEVLGRPLGPKSDGYDDGPAAGWQQRTAERAAEDAKTAAQAAAVERWMGH